MVFASLTAESYLMYLHVLPSDTLGTLIVFPSLVFIAFCLIELSVAWSTNTCFHPILSHPIPRLGLSLSLVALRVFSYFSVRFCT